MEIKVTHNIKQVRKSLDRIQRKQIPFSAAVALTKTAQDVQRAEQRQMAQKLDRPTKQTIGSIRIKTASKYDLTARVFLLPWAAEYLQWQIFGGTRPVSGTAVPTNNARLNNHGNIPGRRTGLLKRKNQFVIKNVGVFKRQGRGKQRKAVMEYAFIDRPKYEPGKWQFYRIAEGVVAKEFPQHFKTALDRALATAR